MDLSQIIHPFETFSEQSPHCSGLEIITAAINAIRAKEGQWKKKSKIHQSCKYIGTMVAI